MNTGSTSGIEYGFYVRDLPGDEEAAVVVVVRRRGIGVATLAPVRASGRLQPEVKLA